MKSYPINFMLPMVVACFLGATYLCAGELEDNYVAGKAVTLCTNGGWCWYQDPRAITDGDKIIAGSVSSPGGDIQVTGWDTASGRFTTTMLHEGLQSDDHAVPAFALLPDGRYLAAYSKHGNDRSMRFRVSSEPSKLKEWDKEIKVDAGAGVTYANLLILGNGKRFYNFHRGIGWDPNYLVSTNGTDWSYGGRLLAGPGRPYLKYASDGLNKIHFITTEQHPRDFDNSIYHGFISNNTVYRSDGTRVTSLSGSKKSAATPSDFTQVFEGDMDNVAWTIDIELDAEGNPYIAFSVQKNRDDQDHRYYYARWSDNGWHVNQMTYAGSCLYDPENDYTGLVALHPDDPNVVFISADAHPVTGEPLISAADGKRHYEIFEGRSSDAGRTWEWEPITMNSTEDNLRPIVPAWDRPKTALLWLRGSYSTYTDYRLRVMGLIRKSAQ
ncbi:MAG: BNR repeat-containing protein [Verrucomicrobia bacterium]|nr:BNR repeat-containing protein [Verrucomicrobiota bacterium]MCF7707411.1 BNR repeat-containing protein [Verrucomicrobiota bacterium]